MANFIKPFESSEELKKRSDTSAQSFDKEKITILRYGKQVNLYDMIQAAREDTEIYPTLEKYGCLKTMETNAEMIYGEIDSSLNLLDLQLQETKLRQLFEEMPAEERLKFDNNYYTFKEKGLEHYQKIAEQEKKQAEENRKKMEEIKNKPVKVEVTNGQDK